MSKYRKRLRMCFNCKNLKRKNKKQWCGVKLPAWVHHAPGETPDIPDGLAANAMFGAGCSAWGLRGRIKR